MSCFFRLKRQCMWNTVKPLLPLHLSHWRATKSCFPAIMWWGVKQAANRLNLSSVSSFSPWSLIQCFGVNTNLVFPLIYSSISDINCQKRKSQNRGSLKELELTESFVTVLLFIATKWGKVIFFQLVSWCCQVVFCFFFTFGSLLLKHSWLVILQHQTCTVRVTHHAPCLCVKNAALLWKVMMERKTCIFKFGHFSEY